MNLFTRLVATTTAFILLGMSLSADEAEWARHIQELKTQLNVQADLLQKLTRTAAPASTDTSIGGYGEMSYTRYLTKDDRTQADLKRFVLFLGHRFNEQISFNSELEWEHAIVSQSDQGESEIEQAFLTYQISSGLALKTGLFLIPFGFINPSHEPPTFYGVERNEIETRIIPSTWREGGLELSGTTETGFIWNVGITTGFDLAKFDDASAPLKASHQELQFAKARDLSYYGALAYKESGFTLGSALFMGNAFHGNADFKADSTNPDFSGITGHITLWDIHTRWQKNGWDFQALYANGTISDTDAIDAVLKTYNLANPTSSRPYVPSEFYGWLVQGAYTLWQEGDMSLTPFARFETYNTQARLPNGFTSDLENADHVLTVGMSFKPRYDVVFKADYQKFNDNPDTNRWALGMGYMF